MRSTNRPRCCGLDWAEATPGTSPPPPRSARQIPSRSRGRECDIRRAVSLRARGERADDAGNALITVDIGGLSTPDAPSRRLPAGCASIALLVFLKIARPADSSGSASRQNLIEGKCGGHSASVRRQPKELNRRK